MKKILSIIIVLTFVLTSFTMISVSAANATTGKIIQYVTEKENTVEVKIAIKGTATDIISATLYIPYDTTKLSFTAGNSGFVANDILSVWNTKQAAASASTTPVSVKVNYGTSVSTNNIDFADGVETVLFTFSFDKINAGESIGAVCPTSWNVIKNGPADAPSQVKSAGAVGEYSNKYTPGLFEVNYTEYVPVSADNIITADITGNGKVLVNGAAVADAGEVNLGEATSATIKVIPAIGYEVATATLGGVNLNIPANGGKTTATVDGEQALVVTFEALVGEDAAKPQASSAIFEQDAVTFPGAAAPAKAKTTFASAPVGVTECGIKLEKDGVAYTTPSGDGPNFASTKALSASNQYGIQFIGLPAGTYTATPYAIVGGETKLGLAVTFTVE